MRWLALIAVALLSPGLVDRALAAPSDPLCVKTAIVHHQTVKVCRAVLNGRLYVFYFVHKQGVWFLLSAQPAANLPTGPSS